MTENTARVRLAALACLVLGPSTGWSEATKPVADADQAGATALQKSGAILEEIVVTAQKRTELLEKTPLALTAVTGKRLQETGTLDAQGLTDSVPGLQVSYTNANTTFSIRGISSNTDATLGDAPVAFHLDGVYQGRPAAASGLFYDIDRIEVLRGPQGTLYGRNATAGTVNVVTNKPSTDKFEGQGEVETGNYGLVRTFGMVNAPLNDVLAVRAAFQTQHHSGYLNTGYNDADDIAGRLQSLFLPSEDFSLLLSADYFHQGGVGRGTVPLPLGADPWKTAGPQITGSGYLSPPGRTDDTSWQVHGELNWKIGHAVLTDIAAFHYLHVNYFAYFNGVDSVQNDRDRETSNELRLSSDSESVAKWVIGAYYHNESQPYSQLFYDAIGPAPDGCCQYLGQGTSLLFVYPTIDNPSYAAFGQLTYPVSDAFRVTGGLRYNRDHKRVTGSGYQVFGSDISFFPGGPVVFPAGSVNQTIATDADTTWTSTNWKFGIDWDVTQNSLAYVQASTGYKQGGVFAGAPPNTYAPEHLTAYEAGLKNRLLGNRLQVNADVFYYKYKDFQVDQLEQLSAPGGGAAYGDVIFNAARATEYGLELETAFAVTETDRVDLSFAYLHAVFDQFNLPLQAPPPNGDGPPAPVVFQNLAGYPPPHAPKVTGTLAYRHIWPLPNEASLAALLQTHVESEQWLSLDHEPGSRQAGFTRSQVDLTYATPGEKFSISAYCKNVENRTVMNSYGWSADSGDPPMVSLSPPRTYGVIFRAKF